MADLDFSPFYFTLAPICSVLEGTDADCPEDEVIECACGDRICGRHSDGQRHDGATDPMTDPYTGEILHRECLAQRY